MHELALTQSIVELVVDRALREGMRAVTRVELEVGAASGVEPEALRFCFDAVTRETAAEGAVLDIREQPLRGRCRDCGLVFDLAGLAAPCPQCHAYAPTVLGGRQLRVTFFEGH